jgi:uncharacterized protein GlcG (DUF336 family)
MIDLTLAAAENLAKSAMVQARAKSLNPLCISVIDITGQIKFALREDGAGMGGVDISLAKARAALTFGCSSREIADALSGNPLVGPSVIASLQWPVALLAGGVLIRDRNGAVIGAIGAAGDAPDNDEAVVIAATQV